MWLLVVCVSSCGFTNAPPQPRKLTCAEEIVCSSVRRDIVCVGEELLVTIRIVDQETREEWLLQDDIADSIAEFRVMTPDRYEREFSMHRGHTPAFAGAPLTALLGTQRALTRYRAPIAGLYLSGAATFPGAGVFGAPGRNTASTVLTDLHGAVGRPLDRIRRRAATIGAS